MVVVQASKLGLPNLSLSSPHISSLLFDPNSQSLALMHSDTSFSLYPSVSPLTLSSVPPPQTLVPPPSSSSAFVLLQNLPNSDPKVLFVVSGPYKGGSQILLRFYVLQSGKVFKRAQVVGSQKDLLFDKQLGVLVDSNHGVSVRLSGSINFFSMYSVASSKVWVFAVNMLENENPDVDDGKLVKLMRCAVIDCCKPVWAINLSFGFLILGEDNGVRVFNLRAILKGRVRKAGDFNMKLKRNMKGAVQKSCLPNGTISETYGSTDMLKGPVVFEHVSVDPRGGRVHGGETPEIVCNGFLEGRSDRDSVSIKQRSAKLRQDSNASEVCFVEFESKTEDSKPRTTVPQATSIQALSPQRFLILDSTGYLSLLSMSKPANVTGASCKIQPLPHVMKVQKLAVLPDISPNKQAVWISDGHHSLVMMVTLDTEEATSEDNGNTREENLQVSVTQTIFAAEKIQEITALAANAVLILGQGSLYAYAIS